MTQPVAVLSGAVVFADVGQPELFDPSELPQGRELLLPVEVQRHQFTGDIVARNQAKYQAIVDGLGEGLGVRQLARAFKVSHHTVQTIREREPLLVATRKEEFGKKLMNLTTLAGERLEEALEKNLISPSQMPVAFGILVDKTLAWSGQSVPRTEIRLELSVERVKGLFAELVGGGPGGTLGLGAGSAVVDLEPVERAALDSESSGRSAKAQ